jgi:biopolymer transport protein ExbD
MSLPPETIFYRHRRRRRSARPIRLLMVPLIDIVFLLLVFFLVTASFRAREGFLPAELPRQSSASRQMELEPLAVQLYSLSEDSCRIQIGMEEPFVVSAGPAEGGGFSLLSREISTVLSRQGRNPDDPVKLIPARGTKWDHVVKAYDAMWQLNLNNIIFAIVE